MVTHDLRMVKYVDRVLQMRDGKLVKVIEDRAEIMRLAKGE
jgi:putative ABC transport system ATP-binding protein